MKTFKKLFALITFAIILCLSFTACDLFKNNQGDNNEEWDKKTYVFYVYLEDGTTPVEGAQLILCTAETCLPGTTDANGRAEITFSEAVTDPCVHFVEAKLPDGYSIPAGGSTIKLSESVSYEDAWTISQKETNFNLTKN